jgi:tyrosine-protein phosphatase SIW14
MEVGGMARVLSWLMGALVATVLVGLPWGYETYRQRHFRNLRTVKPEVLYRSGQMSLAGLQRVVHDYGIRTVVTLRDAELPGDRPPDWAEEEFCKKMAIRHVRITPRHWESPIGGPPPVEEGVQSFLKVMDDSSHFPVLVHCFAGVHRTGAYIAIYRMEYDRWTNAEAIDELKACGYRNLDDEWDVLGYLEQYRPRWWRAAMSESRR